MHVMLHIILFALVLLDFVLRYLLLISLFLRLLGFAFNVIFFLVFQLYILTSFYYVKSEIHGVFVTGS